QTEPPKKTEPSGKEFTPPTPTIKDAPAYHDVGVESHPIDHLPPAHDDDHGDHGDHHDVDGPARKRGGLDAGASLYIVKPYFTNNPAYTITNGAGTPNQTQTTLDFNWDYNATAGAWLGWSSDSGFGLRARYFFFDNNSSELHASLNAGNA